MPRKPIGAISFAKVYPMYVQKVERKGRSKEDVDAVIRWLTGYHGAGLEAAIAGDGDFAEFFDQAPALNPNRSLVTGTICGYRVEEIADPLERDVRILDKLVDEIAMGRPMQKILRS